MQVFVILPMPSTSVATTSNFSGDVPWWCKTDPNIPKVIFCMSNNYCSNFGLDNGKCFHPIMVMVTFYCIWPTKHMIVMNSWFVGLLEAVSQLMVSIHVSINRFP